MKLFELIDPKITTKKIYAGPGRLKYRDDSMLNSKNLQHLGTGSYGSAYAHKNRPGAVIKTGSVDDAEMDGYLNYIRTIGKLASSNPYFPRVYDIRIYKNTRDADDKDVYVAEIEKLSKSDNADAETLMAIGNRAFYDFDSYVNADLRDYYGHAQGKGSPSGRKNRPTFKTDHILQGRLLQTSNDPRKINTTIAHLIHQAMKGDMTGIKDPLLKYALLAIKKLGSDITRNRIPKYYDIHAANMMVRYGPGGAQLVITDPLI